MSDFLCFMKLHIPHYLKITKHVKAESLRATKGIHRPHDSSDFSPYNSTVVLVHHCNLSFIAVIGGIKCQFDTSRRLC